MSAHALQLRGATKRYFDGSERVVAVDSVDLQVPAGEWLVMTGPSGSGKSTLLGLLGGMIVPTSGSVEIAGKSVEHMRDHHRTRWRRERVGFLFQGLALIPRMSLMENVLLPCAPSGGATRSHRERAQALLEALGIGELAARRVERLSGGQRQRGALARALVLEPDVLLLDEPTAHVDAQNAAAILDRLDQEHSEGRTIVMSTHDVRVSSDPRVDRVVEIVDGRLAGE